MALLEQVKSELRVSGTDFNAEITNLIDACILDLQESGIFNLSETDKLVMLAVTLWCKSLFGYEDKDQAERFGKLYESLKAKMGLTGDYNALTVKFTVTKDAVAVPNATITIGDTVLITDSKGVATHSVYVKNTDVDYTVSHGTYGTVTGSIYVDGVEAVAVTL